MVLLWMLWVAVLCKCTQGDSLTSTLSGELHNSDQIHQSTAPTAQILLTTTDILKPVRDKRGTGSLIEQLLRENELSPDDAGQPSQTEQKVKRDSRGNYGDSPRVRFSSWAGKRAKFNSWGGKRGDQELVGLNDDDDMLEDKRAKFSSWAGKRAGEDDAVNWAAVRGSNLNNYNEAKRAKFSSWAGKRDEKKKKISSWAGKRFDDISNYNDILEDKRAKFSSWAGKRAKFNSWGGKRAEEGIEYEDGIVEEKRKQPSPWNSLYGGDKRAKFSSWGGKRADNDWYNGKRARFNSWGGKRSVNMTDNMNDELEHEDGIFKRSPGSAFAPLSWKRKPIFSSWGGKRTARSAQPQRRLIFPSNLFREHSSWGALLRPIRRGPDFYAWGGKRST